MFGFARISLKRVRQRGLAQAKTTWNFSGQITASVPGINPPGTEFEQFEGEAVGGWLMAGGGRVEKMSSMCALKLMTVSKDDFSEKCIQTLHLFLHIT